MLEPWSLRPRKIPASLENPEVGQSQSRKKPISAGAGGRWGQGGVSQQHGGRDVTPEFVVLQEAMSAFPIWDLPHRDGVGTSILGEVRFTLHSDLRSVAQKVPGVAAHWPCSWSSLSGSSWDMQSTGLMSPQVRWVPQSRAPGHPFLYCLPS